MRTATTSPSPLLVLERSASSSACVSNSFSAPSPLRSSRKVWGSRRFGAEASGTSFTQTAIFIGARAYRLKFGRIRLPKAFVSVRPSRANRSPCSTPPDDSPRTSFPSFRLGSSQEPHSAAVPDMTAFPVVGNVSYTDDFGDPAADGSHQGNDIMAVRHQPAVAVEPGWVEKWTQPVGRRLHALPVRQERHGLLVHPPEQRPRRWTTTTAPGCRKAYAPGLDYRRARQRAASWSASSATPATRTGSSRISTSSCTRRTARRSTHSST